MRNDGKSGLGHLQKGLNADNKLWGDFGSGTTEVGDY